MPIERVLHQLNQNTPEWHQFRLEHDGASEAAAALGISKKATRSELLRQKHTGIAKEFSDWVQANILDNGHRVEAMARPLVEELIGDDLYPATYSYGRLSASCDGLTMDGETAFEHKQWNAELATSVARGELPEEHQPQCQQVMYVTGASRLIFVVSDGTKENFVHMEVKPDPAWVDRIVKGWAQFHEDLSNYSPVEVLPAPEATPIKELPALTVQVEGRVVSSNLIAFKTAATQFIANINTDLQTDQHFADAEKTVKFCKEGEERLQIVKAQALAQTSTIDELFRTVDEISAQLRAKRLELDKLVKARKDAIRIEILAKGTGGLADHIAGLNHRLGKPLMPTIPADFAGAMRAKKTIASLRDAVDTELARAKIEANAIADKIQINLGTLQELGKDHGFLFADTAQIVLKAPDDFTALVKLRIAEHREAEAKRLEAERQRIRDEETAKAARAAEQQRLAAETEARRKVEAEQAAERQKREDEERQARTARQAEEDRQRQERLAQERKEREAREAAEAKEREQRKKEQEWQDMHGMLRTFLLRYGDRREVTSITKAIRAYLDRLPSEVKAA